MHPSNKNFVVYRSSAGSGKTFTLVKEYIKLLLEEPDVNYFTHILAITFTNKAAAEMKSRVLQALEAFSSGKIENREKSLLSVLVKECGFTELEIQEKSKKILHRILHNYSNLAIFTIDKFTHKIVRAFAKDLHLPIDFEVSLDKNEVIEYTIDLLLEQIGKDEYITQIVTDFAFYLVDEEKAWKPEKSLQDLAKKMLFNEEHTHALKLLGHIHADAYKHFMQTSNRLIKNVEKEVEQQASGLLLLIHNSGIDEDCFFGKTRGFVSYLKKLAAGDFSRILPTDTVRKAIEEQNFFSGDAKNRKDLKALFEAITPELSVGFNQFFSYIDGNYTSYYIAIQAQRKIHALCLLSRIEEMAASMQGQTNAYLLAGFNHIIHQVVVEEPAPFIYERIGENYRHFMVDEFQDTSLLQWQNLLPLLENALANGNFTMLVGDAKQSIYRWRGGVSEQFTSLPKIFPEDAPALIKCKEPALQANFQEVKLNANYRSFVEVIDFNNRFFTHMKELVGAASEDYKDVIQLFDKKKTGGSVEIQLFDKSLKHHDAAYADALDRKLEELQEAGFTYADIAILVSKNDEAAFVADYLSEKQVPVVSPNSVLLVSSPYVQLMITCLSMLQGENDILKKTKFIRQYAITYNKQETFTEMFETFITTKKSAALILKELSGNDFSKSSFMQLSLIEQCFFLAKYFQLPLANTYVLTFFDTIKVFSENNIPSIDLFLSWWEEKAESISVSMPKNADAIQVMTIHKSKGLEFPAVIFFAANKQVKRQKDFVWVENVIDEEKEIPLLLLSMNKEMESTQLNDVYEYESNRSKIDLLNEMYVAFTRAINRLYIFTAVYEAKKDTESVHIPKLIDSFINKQELKEVAPKTFLFGKKMPYTHEGKTQAKEPTALVMSKSKPWRKLLKQKSPVPDEWVSDIRQDARYHGTIIHDILASATSIQDIERANIDMRLSSETQQEIKKTALKIWQTSGIEDLLNKGYKAVSEKAILASGRQFIPDKALVQDKQAVLFDFKTGMPDNKHQKQVKEYVSLYKQMGYTVENAWVVYPEQSKAVF